MRIAVILFSCLVLEACSQEMEMLKRSTFKAASQNTVSGRWGISQEETDKAIEDREHALPPVERNVTTNIFEKPTTAPSGSHFPSFAPSTDSLPVPSRAPSSVPSTGVPSSTPSTSTPTITGGVPTNLPPIPLFPTSTPPPTPQGGAPITLPPIPLFPSGTAPPITAGPNGVPAPTQPPVEGPPVDAPTTPSPVGGQPVTIPPVPLTPTGTLPPTPAPIPPVPTAPTSGVTVEEFLTSTLTDDGSLQEAGTPQNLAFLRLGDTNPTLDANLPEDQIEISQRYSLNTLYFANNGPNWVNSRDWTTEVPICDVASATNWFGITCDTTGSLVTQLTMRQNGLIGSLPSEIRGLASLSVFDLGSNLFIAGVIPSTIGEMTSLQSLILDLNSFGAEIDETGNVVGVLQGALPSEIGQVASLVTLDLQNNFFGSQAPLPWEFFTTLGSLGPIATTIGQLPASLTSLDLSANAFTGTLPSELGQVVALTDLKMARSDFQPTPDGTCGDVNANPLGCIRGTIPTELGQLVNLRTLWLFEHSLTGTLPTEFGNMASLSEFLVYANAVSGDVPAPFVALPSLVAVDLSTNFFGPTLPAGLFNKPTMEFLSLGTNSFVDTFPTTFTLPAIRVLSLRQSVNVTGVLPTTIGELTTLQNLDIFLCSLTGTLPTQIGNLVAMQAFDAELNFLTGTIPVELGNLIALQSLNLNFNQFGGTIPRELAFAGNLILIDFGFNFLTGTIPNDLGFLINLQGLDLQLNRLSGSIPSDFVGLASLRELDLSINALSGPIPPQLGSLLQLQELVLQNNTLTGMIPTELGSLTALTTLDLSINSLVGTIPSVLALITGLNNLILYTNAITGVAPLEICGLRPAPLVNFETDCQMSNPLVECSCCSACGPP